MREVRKVAPIQFEDLDLITRDGFIVFNTVLKCFTGRSEPDMSFDQAVEFIKKQFGLNVMLRNIMILEKDGLGIGLDVAIRIIPYLAVSFGRSNNEKNMKLADRLLDYLEKEFRNRLITQNVKLESSNDAIMNDISVFTNIEFGEVRTFLIDDQIYFIGSDIATILKYSNPGRALQVHIDRQYRKIVNFNKIEFKNKPENYRNMTNMTLITEPGLYQLIFRSQMPKAKEFMNWICEEVLPTLREKGVYIHMKSSKLDALTIKLVAEMFMKSRTALEKAEIVKETNEKLVQENENIKNMLKRGVSENDLRMIAANQVMSDLLKDMSQDVLQALIDYKYEALLEENPYEEKKTK